MNRKRKRGREGEKALTSAQRTSVIRALGFLDYPAYLDGDAWQHIRARVLWRYRRCRLCRKWASQVHHDVYTKANLTGESTDGLYAICGTCHLAIEFDGEGNKRERAAVQAEFRRLFAERRAERSPVTEAQAIWENSYLTREFRAIVGDRFMEDRPPPAPRSKPEKAVRVEGPARTPKTKKRPRATDRWDKKQRESDLARLDEIKKRQREFMRPGGLEAALKKPKRKRTSQERRAVKLHSQKLSVGRR